MYFPVCFFIVLFAISLLLGVPEVERGQSGAEESCFQKSTAGANTHWICTHARGTADLHSVLPPHQLTRKLAVKLCVQFVIHKSGQILKRKKPAKI